MVITQNEKDSFFNQGFFVRKKTISETTVESAKIAYTKMRKKDDFGHYLNKNIAEIATDNWKSVFKDDLPEPLKWSEPEIVHKNSGFKKLPHIIFNRLIYYLSFFYFGNFRKLEQWPIKYPYLKGKF